MRDAQPLRLQLHRRNLTIRSSLCKCQFVVKNQINHFQIEIKPQVITSVPSLPSFNPSLRQPGNDAAGEQTAEEGTCDCVPNRHAATCGYGETFVESSET